MRYESALNLSAQLREELHGPRARRQAFEDAAKAGRALDRIRLLERYVPWSVRLPMVRRVGPSLAEIQIANVRRMLRPAVGVAVGEGPEDYRLAIRTFIRSPETEEHVRRLSQAARGEVDVDHVGLLRAYALGIGTSVGRLDPVPVTGTLGCFLQRQNAPTIELLSCNHVLAALGRRDVGDVVLSPGPEDGGTNKDIVGVLTKVVPLEPKKDNLVDAALARPNPSIPVEPAPLDGGGHLTGVSDAVPTRGMVVVKTGRATGRTMGQVSAASVGPLPVDYSFIGGGFYYLDAAVEIRPRDAIFSRPGDSGALIWDARTHEAIGILVAGPVDPTTDRTQATYATPMRTILDVLEAGIVT